MHGREDTSIQHFHRKDSVRKRYSWNDNIKLDLKEIIWGSVNWTRLVLGKIQYDRLLQTLYCHKMLGIVSLSKKNSIELVA